MSKSAFTFVCLLVHHGVWNEQDHDVFKSLIATCKRIYQYVHTNKPLVRILFENLTLLATKWLGADYKALGGRKKTWLSLNGLREGIYSECRSGLICRTFYHNDVLEGSHTRYFGQICQKKFFRKGVLEGLSVQWHANGTLARQCSYQNGQLIGEYLEWYSNGQLSLKAFYQSRTLHGEYLEWHSNGQLSKKAFYQSGTLHGEYLEWHENGQQHGKAFYRSGQKNGEYIQWFANGQLMKREIYQNGVKKSGGLITT